MLLVAVKPAKKSPLFSHCSQPQLINHHRNDKGKEKQFLLQDLSRTEEKRIKTSIDDALVRCAQCVNGSVGKRVFLRKKSLMNVVEPIIRGQRLHHHHHHRSEREGGKASVTQKEWLVLRGRKSSNFYVNEENERSLRPSSSTGKQRRRSRTSRKRRRFILDPTRATLAVQIIDSPREFVSFFFSFALQRKKHD